MLEVRATSCSPQPTRRRARAIVLLTALLSGTAMAFTFHAAAQERRPPGPRPTDSCEVRAQSDIRYSECLKCRDGYLKKGGVCLRGGDFGTTRPKAPRRDGPINPSRP